MAILFGRAEPFEQFRHGSYEEHSCEIILNLDRWFRKKSLLKILLIWCSGGHLVQWSITIRAIFIEGIMRNIYVNLF